MKQSISDLSLENMTAIDWKNIITKSKRDFAEAGLPGQMAELAVRAILDGKIQYVTVKV